MGQGEEQSMQGCNVLKFETDISPFEVRTQSSQVRLKCLREEELTDLEFLRVCSSWSPLCSAWRPQPTAGEKKRRFHRLYTGWLLSGGGGVVHILNQRTLVLIMELTLEAFRNKIKGML